MKKGLLVFIILLLLLVPVYFLYTQLAKWIRPRTSFPRLLLYFISGLALVFICTFIVVLIVQKLLHGA